nr:MAG TPA_asm: hypothetical protein [Caudoviricetes sp.]
MPYVYNVDNIIVRLSKRHRESFNIFNRVFTSKKIELLRKACNEF